MKSKLNQIPMRLLMLVCVAWLALAAMAQFNVANLESGKTYRIKCGGSVNDALTYPYLYDNNGTVSSQANDYESTLQQWVVTAVVGKDGFYTVQNVSTGNYLVPVTSTVSEATTSSTKTEVYLKKKVVNSVAWFNILADANSQYSYNKHPNKIAGWTMNDADVNGSDWAFLLLPDEAQAAAGESKPVVGDDYYTIHSALNSSTTYKMAEANGYATLIADDNTDDYTQYWKLVDAGDGKIAFQNVLTGHYIQHNGQHDAAYTTGTDADGFTVSANDHILDQYRYDITDTGTSYGFNSTDKGMVYSWEAYDGASNSNSLWWFKKAELTEALEAELQKLHLTSLRDERLQTILTKGVVRIQTAKKTNYGSYPGGYITDIWEEGSAGTTCHMRAEKASTADDYYRQVWVVEKSGSGYTMRNLYTGRYLNMNNTSESAVTLYIHFNPNNTDLTDDKVSISTKSDYSEHNCVHYQEYNDLVVGWEENADASNWYFSTPDISDDVVRARFDVMDSHITNLSNAVSSSTENKWVYIRNLNGNYMTENVSTSQGQVTERINGNYAQIWQLTPVTGKEGYYQLKNALTRNFVQFADYNAQHTLGTDEAEGGYKVNDLNSVFRFNTYFEIHPTSLLDKAVHRSNERLLTWNAYNGGSDTEGSVWYFVDANVTDAEVEAARSAYTANNTEKASADAYNTALQKYFTDASCTELAAAYKDYSDENLKSAMASDGITSDVLQQMAVKVKNDAWEKWEKTFRLQQVQPFSDPWKWNDDLKVGFVYTNLSNPTGVYIPKYGDLAYVFVGADIPENCSMAAIMVPKTDTQGTEVTLRKGLNIIQCPSEYAALFIRYTVPTSLADTKTKIADFQKIPVHIEGGTVNGYFDLPRQSDGIGTDEAWKEMLTDGLITKFPFCQMKGERTVFNMNSTLVKKYVPEQMSEIIGFWDWVLQVEHETAGLDAYRDRWNNYMGNYSVTYNFMFATSYGTYYNEETLETILTYDNGKDGGMKYSGGDLWGPAHEMGHIHQQLFNMIGCTEISNNVFSNAVLFRNGRTTTRTAGEASIHSVAEKFAKGTCWHDYNLWERTRMYFQLYLYYHVQGHKKDFYPRLFDAFRSDPIIRRHPDGSAVPATEDFLHFALKCCEVSGDDLSEFFQAYGMFVPFEQHDIDDYGTFPTYATQEEIDAAIAKMHTYAKPKGNILFIEDHIRLEQAIDHDGNPLVDDSGNAILRKDYEDNCAVGKMGDVGQYTDYTDGNYADGYSCTISDEGVVTMEGKGAVGYKVYDSEGNLLYFSNSNTFTLPASVLAKLNGTTPVVKAAQANGSDVTLPTGDVKYEVKVYRANSSADDKVQTVYTDLTEATLPKLEGNDLAYVSGENAVEALTSKTNYVNADDNTAKQIVLTDLKDFYAPTAFTTENLTYTRKVYEGYNSVCLPFDFEPSDFGEGTEVETFSGTDEKNGTTSLVFTTANGNLPAGTPCLVKCTADNNAYEIVKTNVKVTTKPISVSVGSTVTMEGSFLNRSIGQGKYKLNDAGTKFGITTAKGMVGAFRSYLAPAAGALQMPLSFGVQHMTTPATGIQQVQGEAQSEGAACYDLSGRRISQPVQKGVYIINGKKIIK